MKKNYKKIDLYLNGIYQASTTWSKSCKEALERYKQANGCDFSYGKLTARFAPKEY